MMTYVWVSTSQLCYTRVGFGVDMILNVLVLCLSFSSCQERFVLFPSNAVRVGLVSSLALLNVAC